MSYSMWRDVADHELAHRELEQPRRERDAEQDQRVASELVGGDAAVEIVDRVLQNLLAAG